MVPFLVHPKIRPETQAAFRRTSFCGFETGRERAALLWDNEDALAERIRLIAHARDRVILSTFEFRSDTAGRQVFLHTPYVICDRWLLERLAALADGVVTWGGDGAVSALRRLAPSGCKLMEWGHRLSFAYVAGYEDREAEWSALARHIVRTGGLLCSSCQVIFLDTGRLEEGEAFCQAFLPLLNRAARERDRDGAAQAALYTHTYRLERLAEGAGGRTWFGEGCSLTLKPDRELELSHLYGNVLVKCLPREELIPVLRRQKGRLQTAGLLCRPEKREELTALLARAGVTRITRAGEMSRTFPGEAHDGEYSLRRYIRLVDIET